MTMKIRCWMLSVILAVIAFFMSANGASATGSAGEKTARPRQPAFSYPSPRLQFMCTPEPLRVEFDIIGKHYSGEVSCGNLFLQPDIPRAPTVSLSSAHPDKLYTLMMIDPDGNADGSWPDPVPPGKNAPVRHWVIGNIPGTVLQKGYLEQNGATEAEGVTILQRYRAPHIPRVSDRYGLFLFAQHGRIRFDKLEGPVTNFDYGNFIKKYQLDKPKASNFFVAVYMSASPFSGIPFHGNDLPEKFYKKDLWKGATPCK